MFRFEELDIWKLAIEYADYIYDLTAKLPLNERYNLSDQLRRAVLSVSNNIAEGSGRATARNFNSFLDISLGSIFETVSILYFAKKRKYINEEERKKTYEIAELLTKKIRSFKNSLK